MAQQITSRPGLFIAGYTVLALALGALVIALRGYDLLLFILIWPVILSAMLVPWRMYLILIGIGVTVTAITVPLVVPDLNQSAMTAAAATASAFLICESVYRFTRRQRAMARALQESEERFRCTFERAPAPMAVTDLRGRLKWFNQRLCEMVGYERDALHNRMIDNFAHPEDQDHRLHPALLASDDGEATIEKRYIAKDGRIIPMLVKGTLLRNAAGEPHEVLVIFFDLTAQREAEAQRLAVERAVQETQRLESMGTLAGGLAHDFNNLLATILGNANLALLDTAEHAPVRAYLEQIEIAAQRAAELTQQILAYTGRGQIATEIIDVNRVINDLKAMLNAAVPSTLSIDYQVAQRSLMVCFDRIQLRQIIVALINNAVDAIGDGAGQIIVTTGERVFDDAHLLHNTVGARLRAGCYAVIEVRDTGGGIDEQTMEHLFAPFFTTKQGRRGLGLAATLGIVRSHNGAIQVESIPGQGSTFRVFIPMEQNGPKTETAPVALDTSPPLVQQPAIYATQSLVLIVDDERAVRSVTARMVEHSGFATLQAPDGATGVDLFRANADSIGCVLLDVSMPAMDGAQALQRMRAIRPDAAIVLMSGYAGEELAERFAQLRPDGFLYKPFDIAELKACLEGVIRKGVRAG